MKETSMFLKLCDVPAPKNKVLAFFTSQSGACASLRLFQPAKHLNQFNDISYHASSHYILAYPSPDMPLFQTTINPAYEGYDTFIHQRETRKEVFEFMMLSKRLKGIRQIYEIDDDLLNLPSYNPYVKEIGGVIGTMKYFFHHCDDLTCTTEPLKEVLKQFNPNVHVIPNAIDFEFFGPYGKTDADYDKEDLVIGWTGTPYHLNDILMVEQVITDIVNRFDNVKFLYGGSNQLSKTGRHELFKEIPHDKLIIKPWVTMNNLPHMMKDIDIGICPLEDNKFNASKSNLKYLQLSALGIPSICSDVYPYSNKSNTTREGIHLDGSENRILVKPSYDDWYQALELLITSEIQRRVLGKNARELVMERYNQKEVSKQWHELLTGGKA